MSDEGSAPGGPAAIEPGCRRDADVLTERDWGILRVYTEQFSYWLEVHAGVIVGGEPCTRREGSPCQHASRDYAYTEAMVSTERLREAVGALMSVMVKLGRGVPG